MNSDVKHYHEAQAPADRAICDLLAAQIDAGLPEAENKIWHAHPGRAATSHTWPRFIATSSEPRASTFWQAVGNALQTRVGLRPVWLSTAGLGVSWLHVRLDSRPKYYRHAPYKPPPGA